MEVSISLHSNDSVTLCTTDKDNVLFIKLSSSNKNVIYSSTLEREQIAKMLGEMHDLLYETNGELKKGDVITIGHKHASDGILNDYSDKIGLRAVVVDPNVLWSIDEYGNEIRFVLVVLEGKKKNKYVDIHLEDAIRVTV